MSGRNKRTLGMDADRVSIASVAKRAGVSIATVSRVVNGVPNKASSETVQRVRDAITTLGYRPAGAGQALRSRQSRLVAVLAANLANPTMAAIAASVEVSLRTIGLVMVLCDTHDQADLQDEYLLEMRAHQVRASVLLGAVESPGLAAAQAGEDTLLFVGRRCPFPNRRDAPFVGIDNIRASQEVADFLVQRGRRDPAVIHGSLSSSATADRVGGFCSRMIELALPVAADSVRGGQGLDHLTIGYEAMAKLLDRPGALLDSVFCSSDLIAFGAQRCAAERGISPQTGILFVGFDDNPLNPWVAPWLNSVRVPYDRFGWAIVDALEALWAGQTPVAYILEHELHIRT